MKVSEDCANIRSLHIIIYSDYFLIKNPGERKIYKVENISPLSLQYYSLLHNINHFKQISE